MNDIWNKKREVLEEQLKTSTLALFSHMGSSGACKIDPIPNTTPQVFIIAGDARAIKSMLEKIE